jgi:hypothetical protein
MSDEVNKEVMLPKLKTVNIQGKEYVMVNERLKYFREKFPGWGLRTTVMFHNVSEVKEFTFMKDDKQVTDVKKIPGKICIVAKVINPEGKVTATGMAMETEGAGMVNKTSYVENCETSAWGRALANQGIGIDDSVGSADEVALAISQQS